MTVLVIPGTPQSVDSDDEEDKSGDASLAVGYTDMITHTVSFKCIGSTKEDRYQDALVLVSHILAKGEHVECAIKPEPDNPMDSRAIAFNCKLDGKWRRIGYIVQEAVEDVHDALKQKAIMKVMFDCLQYVPTAP